MSKHSQPSEGGAPVLMIVLCTAAFMASLDLFIVNVALDAISRDFAGPALSDLSWILNGYTVVYAALLIPAGRLADRYGRRRAFLLGLGLFTAASAGCAFAPSLWPLVGFRLIQAAGAAILTPASLGLVLAAFSGARRARAVRIWAASGAIAAAAGPVIGGVLVQTDWRWVFLVNLPVGLAALLIGALVIAESRDPAITSLPDLAGAAALALSIGALALGTVKGQSWGWTSVSTAAVFALAATALALVHSRSQHHAVPVVEPALIAIRSFAWSNAAALAFSAAFAANLLLLVLWLQRAWGWSALKTGMAVAPGPLMVPALAVVAHLARRRVGPGAITAAGCVLLGVGVTLMLVSISLEPRYTHDMLPGLLVGGAGVGLALPEILASTASLPVERSATGSAIVNMTRQIGAVVGVSAAVAMIDRVSSPQSALDRFHTAWWAVVGAAAVGGAVAIGMTPRVPRTATGLVRGGTKIVETPAPENTAQSAVRT